MRAPASAPSATRRRRGAVLRGRAPRIGVAAVLMSGAGAGIVAAKPPGGVAENPGTAVATVAPNPVALGGVVIFTGTGFGPAEEVSVKIDDGDILKKNSQNDVLVVVTANADGTLSGSIDTSQVNAATPVNAGTHLLRFLSAFPHSLHADFSVIDPNAPVATPTPAPGQPTPAATPGATPVPTTPVAKGSDDTAVTSPITLGSTKLTVSKAKVSVALRSGAAGSAGTVKLRTADRVKVGGKGKAKLVTLSKTDSYYLGKVAKATVKLTLSADGKKVLKKGKTVKAVLVLEDAAGISITQNVTIRG